jgi:carbon monoxide dehydrogenase subunit G
MKLSGSYKLNVKKEHVWEALNDPDILKKCIPGCENFDKESSTVFNATATNQIGPMNATFSGIVTLSNIKKNLSYTISGEGQSSVGFAKGNADIQLIEENNVTTLSYKVSVDVGGKIAQLGSRLIDGVAKKMSDYFFGRFADLVAPVLEKKETGSKVERKRVKEIQSNFLNKYIYSAIFIFILLSVAIFYFVSR